MFQHEERSHEPGMPYSWEAVDIVSANYTPDITPLILAAHKNNYEILKILLDRGASLPTPHDLKCSCEACITGMLLYHNAKQCFQLFGAKDSLKC